MTTDRRLAAGVVAICATAIVVSALGVSAQTQTPAPPVDYVRDVRPILEQPLLRVPRAQRSPRAAAPRRQVRRALKGGVDGPAVIPGNADDSLLVRRVLGLDGEDRMPLDKDRAARRADRAAPRVDRAGRGLAGRCRRHATAVTLAPEDAPQHWAYRQPVRPTPPAVSHNAWVREPHRPVRRSRAWRRKACSRRPRPSKEALIRRVSLDLIGLPPTPAEIDAFVADTAPRRLRAARRSPAGLAALWRALGASLARSRPLRRQQRLREGRPADDVEVPRLGDQGAERRHAVRPVHDRADRRRHAAQRHDAIS